MPIMASITITLSDERLAKLEESAALLGVSPEELARRSIEDLLDQHEEEFRKAAEYVVTKNAELYRRLA